jgi:hypothetical protein
MEIEIFTLCDYAQEHAGKLFINGTFDLIHGQEFPLVHPAFAIAGRFRFAETEGGPHKLKLAGKTPKGADFIQPIEGEIFINKPNPPLDYTSTNFAITFSQLKFDEPGVYTFELYIDDVLKSGLKVLIVKQQ